MAKRNTATVFTMNSRGGFTSGGARLSDREAREEALSPFHAAVAGHSGNGVVYCRLSTGETRRHLAMLRGQTSRPYLRDKSCRAPLAQT